MSSRSSSEFGGLAERVARTPPATPVPARSATHVDVRDDQGTWQPGLLIAWQHPGDTWWGLTVWAPHGEAIEELIRADRLRPATGPPKPAAADRTPNPT